jgi:hypothetical protein
MDIEFHYYINFLIALAAGYNKEEANIIAYSSQYTDDNCDKFTVITHLGNYKNEISQTNKIITHKDELQKIYTCIHFIPGSPQEIQAERKDDVAHLLATTANNFIARTILSAALKSKNLYWIGIASHAYADTFAHHGFTGSKDDFNAKPGLKEKLIPNIGHADFLHYPDICNAIWIDARLINEEVNNKTRFINAIYHLCKIYNSTKKYPLNFFTGIANIIGEPFSHKFSFFKPGLKKRIEAYNAFSLNEFKCKIPIYKKNLWQTNAFECVNNLYFSRDDFYSSDWYKFQEALKIHYQFSWKMINKRTEFYNSAKQKTTRKNKKNEKLA